jgi:hypothetical protein
MAGWYNRRLATFDSATPLELIERPIGTYEQEFLIEGNSILSTIFVESLDPGASLEVTYHDHTTGELVGEQYDLADHRIITSPIDSDRLTVTRIHNHPVVRCNVIGGNVKFSVYITVIASFASDLDAALKFNDQIVALLKDKGMPIMGVDYVTGKYNFLKQLDGILQVGISNDNGILNTSIVSGNIAIGTTAIPLFVAPAKMAGRKILIIQPKNGTIFIGALGVTTSTGIEVVKKQIVRISTDVQWYGISAVSLIPGGGVTSSLVEGK